MGLEDRQRAPLPQRSHGSALELDALRRARRGLRAPAPIAAALSAVSSAKGTCVVKVTTVSPVWARRVLTTEEWLERRRTARSRWREVERKVEQIP